MQQRHRLLLIVFALLSLVASVAALYVHYRIMTTPDYTSFCDVNATVSCQDVLSSSYSRVAGIPIAAACSRPRSGCWCASRASSAHAICICHRKSKLTRSR